VLSISHRWMEPTSPDPDGQQLKATQDFLKSKEGQGVKLVWLDSACMPQDHPRGSRSAEDTASFKRMLKEINMLFLGTSVLILLDISYLSRCAPPADGRTALPSKPNIQLILLESRVVCAQSGRSLRRG
jgi:hypothetical protein